VIGAKPAAFCRWVFELLGAAPGDVLEDLFPGSGAVGRAWQVYASRLQEHDGSG
jgi:DNA modification methylase